MLGGDYPNPTFPGRGMQQVYARLLVAERAAALQYTPFNGQLMHVPIALSTARHYCPPPPAIRPRGAWFAGSTNLSGV